MVPWKELCDVGVVTLGHVLVPALLHLVLLHVVHILHLKFQRLREIYFWSLVKEFTGAPC